MSVIAIIACIVIRDSSVCAGIVAVLLTAGGVGCMPAVLAGRDSRIPCSGSGIAALAARLLLAQARQGGQADHVGQRPNSGVLWCWHAKGLVHQGLELRLGNVGCLYADTTYESAPGLRPHAGMLAGA